ncbi:Type III secretion system outer membrane protein SpiA [invertebrate metagenome]|uniref:Type III secretion system outer membrane protein SpiA n=1 Tax=invertebrate metagenome TaxID=1711999 RepID=A0A2H9TCV6_9ZZZZ
MFFLRMATFCAGVLFTLGSPVRALADTGWPSSSVNTCIHTVRSGETLSIIARNYGLERNELLAVNPISNPNRLQVGQELSLPSEDGICAGVDPVLATNPFSSQAYETFEITPPQTTPENNNFLNDFSHPQAASDALSLNDFSIKDFPENLPQGGLDSAPDYNFLVQPPVAEPVKAPVFAIAKPAMEQPKENEDDFSDYMCKAAVAESPDVLAENKTESDDEIDDGASPALNGLSDRPYAYYASSEALTDVLKNFAGSYYVPLIMAEGVNGEVNGKIGPMTPIDFLDHMANIYGFMWYFDGHSLFVYNSDATQQSIISLNYLTTDQLRQTLKKTGIWDGRFFWKAQPKEGMVVVSGPPRYVEMVSNMATLLDEKEGTRQKSQLTVCTFRLKYAWATDKSFSIRGEQVIIPGVATLLQNIISGGGVADISRSELPQSSIEPAKSATRSKRNQKNQKDDKTKEQLNDGADAEAIFINADPRMNAVIIHDLTSKMPMYGELVKSLDKPSSQIEINVSIIEVSASHVTALGVDWHKTERNNSIVSLSFNEPNPSEESPDYFPYTTILSADIKGFQASLNLLASKGKAKIMSRPSVLTLDNLEAVLDNSSTTYVQVQSNEDAQLFPVTSGTMVQVTPRIVNEKIGRTIHMSINIQDGSDENPASQEREAITTKVTNSSINTQAIVHENESLLVGGFYKEIESNSSGRIPGLSKLPLIGHLFKSDTKQFDKVVKMFLISPRIVDSIAHRQLSRFNPVNP